MNSDPLINQLREEAARFDPAPPPAVRRAVLEAIAALETTPAPRMFLAGALARWSIAATALALVTAAIVIVLAVRHRPAAPGIGQTPQEKPLGTPTLSFPSTSS